MARSLSLVPTDAAPEALSPAEQARLTELEQTIETGITAAFEAGRALQEIRDVRLYRQTHATFADYLRER